ncbi:MAG: PRC-barrel domain-containing protein [Desulfobacterales bacterium]
MNRRSSNWTIIMLGVVCLTLALLTTAYAAEKKTAATDIMAEKVLGMEIKTQQGEDVGEIKNVLFDRKGKIKEYLVDVGGFLGIGEKTVGVSPSELTYNAAEDYAVFNGSESQLENKKEVDYSSYGYNGGYYPYRTYPGYMYGPRYADDPNFDGRYPPRGYAGDYGRGYGYGPYAGPYMGRQQNQAGNQQSRQSDRYQDRGQRSQDYGRGYYPSNRQGDGNFDRSDISLESLINSNVRTQNGEDVGEIENLVISRRGRITHAVIDVGGFLGIGEKRVAVPFKELENIGAYFVMYPGTEAQLENMPAYKGNQVTGDGQNQPRNSSSQDQEAAQRQTQSNDGQVKKEAPSTTKP